MPRRASSSNLMILLIENVSFRDADRVRCPRRTATFLRRPHRTDGLITLHVGVLTKILALTTTECKARSRALSPMRSGRNNLRRGRGGPTERAYTPGAGGSAQRSLPWLFRTKLCTPCLLSGRAQQNSPSAGPPPTLPRNNSPSMGPPPGHLRKSSPSAPENSVFRPFWVCRANFFALTHTSSRAGRTFSRIGHSHVATLKPMTPLQPLTRASMKPPSPLLTPDQQPLKPTTPQQPKNAPKTPISRPQRRRRFQLAHLTGPQRRRWFQLRLSLREQRCHRFQTTAHLAYARRLRHQQASMPPLPRKLACNSTGRNLNNARKRCNSNDQNSRFEIVSGELHAKLGAAQECGK